MFNPPIFEALGSGLIGGAIIGASASMLMYASGKITGISGMIGTLVNGNEGASNWRWSFLSGMLASGFLLAKFNPSAFGSEAQTLSVEPWVASLAGFLMGVGTSMGSGCTSGHGVCGLPRRSPRSLVAVCTFISVAALSRIAVDGPLQSLVTRTSTSALSLSTLMPYALAPLGAAAALTFLLHSRSRARASAPTESTPTRMHVVALGAGALFALGLGRSGMTNPGVLADFLNPFSERGWNVTMAGVMMGAIGVNMLTFHALHANDGAPPLGGGKSYRDVIKLGMAEENVRITKSLVVGAALFGIGWGVTCMCPGPAVVSLASLSPLPMLVFPSLLLGTAVHHLFEE